jgi:multiple sugar transport system substrate-binding protein
VVALSSIKNYKQFKGLLKFLREIGLSRILGLLFAFLLGLLIVLPGMTKQPVTLTLLMNAIDAAQWGPMVRDFEAQNPDIRLNIIEGPNATNLVEDLYTSAFLLGDSPYDLIYMDVVWAPKFAAAGWLMDLSNRTSYQELGEFLDVAVNAGRYQEGLYSIPHRSDAGMLYYRKDLLEQAGFQPPKTFAELMQTSQALQKQNVIPWGYVWQGRQYEGLAAMFVEVLAGYGGYWVNPETGEVGLDQASAIEAVEFLRRTIELGVSPPGITTYGEEESRRLFQSGKVAFLRNWPYVWALAKDSPVAGKMGIESMVRTPGHSSGACLGGWGLGIATSTKHPDQAWRAIQYLTSADAQRQFILASGYVPSRPALFNDPQIVARYSHYPKLLEVVEKAVLRPPIPQYAQASDILQRYLSAALTGRLSSKKAMQSAAAETRLLLGRVQPQAQIPQRSNGKHVAAQAVNNITPPKIQQEVKAG